MVSYVINCDYSDVEAKVVRADIAVKLANLQPSANGRNYLLTYTMGRIHLNTSVHSR